MAKRYLIEKPTAEFPWFMLYDNKGQYADDENRTKIMIHASLKDSPLMAEVFCDLINKRLKVSIIPRKKR